VKQIVFLLTVFISVPGFAQSDSIGKSIYYTPVSINDSVIILREISEHSLSVTDKTKKERVRLTAAILCITLGPFGVHRLYLGTSTSVPVFYTITLGGGFGLLPVIDLFLIVFSKDLEKFKNNPHVFMWTDPAE
jgi:TM2 domain-containing membrane protein YozV